MVEAHVVEAAHLLRWLLAPGHTWGGMSKS
jgi:hypothetical protein